MSFSFTPPADLDVPAPASPQEFDPFTAFSSTAKKRAPAVSLFNQLAGPSEQEMQAPREVACFQLRDILAKSEAAKAQQCTIFSAISLGAHLLEDKVVRNLGGVELLRLSGNQLADLPASLSELQSLRVLNMADNRLSCVPPAVLELASLTHLNLSRNVRISCLPHELGRLKQLSLLHVPACSLSKLPSSLGLLRGITDLDLHDNHLSLLPSSICRLPLLRHLRIQGNELAALPAEIGELSALQTLLVQGNRLESLPSSIGSLRNCWSMDISNNSLGSIPRSLAMLTSCTALALEGNPFDELPQGLSTEEFLRYVRLNVHDVTVSSSSYSSDLAQMVRSNRGGVADVQVVVEKESFDAHLCFLKARATPSTFVEDLVGTPRLLHFQQLESAADVASALEFLYTGNPEVLTRACELLFKTSASDEAMPATFASLRQTHPEDCDIDFLVDGQVVSCHKAVLIARCAYFEQMLSSSFAESRQERIELSDVTFSAFVTVIDYLYSDEARLTVDNCIDVLKLANRFTLPRLKELTEVYISQELEPDDEETLVALFLITEQHKANQLLSVYTRELARNENFSELIETMEELQPYKVRLMDARDLYQAQLEESSGILPSWNDFSSDVVDFGDKPSWAIGGGQASKHDVNGDGTRNLPPSRARF